ncbi:MAG: (2Fe-2S) ferredoxin domain-containing protein [Gammaproteobacteria bacterium]|nr:(2Fe-2S) ferredoxin domain-containing protein [Gammaproteobacteria bacterium]MBT4493825.1 (2Fe-2S) ferredoxin domain-containing protein [Gammaproteobacteria bacterium]MBT7370421.1 (2Fe-2S) ferredoxin domain-containing protein [Gammaproteobacteria bacterium]
MTTSRTIVACTNFRPSTTEPSCAQRGSLELIEWLEAEIEARGLDIQIDRAVCLGHCRIGPNFRQLGGEFVHEATKKKLIELINTVDESE